MRKDIRFQPPYEHQQRVRAELASPPAVGPAERGATVISSAPRFIDQESRWAPSPELKSVIEHAALWRTAFRRLQPLPPTTQIAPFDQEHERAQRILTALERIGPSLHQDVQSAAHNAVTKALSEVHLETQYAANALRDLQRFSRWQTTWQSALIALVTMLVTLAAVWT
jgi:hypothetical protein